MLCFNALVTEAKPTYDIKLELEYHISKIKQIKY